MKKGCTYSCKADYTFSSSSQTRPFPILKEQTSLNKSFKAYLTFNNHINLHYTALTTNALKTA